MKKSYSQIAQEAQENGASFSQIPVGDYVAEITHTNFKVRSSGNEAFGFLFRVTEGPEAGSSSWHNITLSDKNGHIALPQLNAVGVAPEVLDNLGPEEGSKVAVGGVFAISVVPAKDDRYTDIKVRERRDAPAPAPAPAPVAPAPAPVAAEAAPAAAPTEAAPAALEARPWED